LKIKKSIISSIVLVFIVIHVKISGIKLFTHSSVNNIPQLKFYEQI